MVQVSLLETRLNSDEEDRFILSWKSCQNHHQNQDGQNRRPPWESSQIRDDFNQSFAQSPLEIEEFTSASELQSMSLIITVWAIQILTNP